MILILSYPDDNHAERVVEELKTRGADFVQFDHAEFPRRANISCRMNSHGKSSLVLTRHSGERFTDVASDEIDLARVTAIVGSSRVDLQACKLEYSIVSPK